MKPINIFGVGIKSRSENVTAQRRVNLFFETNDEKNQIVAYRTPGLKFISDVFGGVPVRGWLEVEDRNVFYAVTGNTVYEVDVNYIATNIGTITTTTGFVSMASNGLELILVDGIKGWTYNYGTSTFAEITSGGFLGGTTVTFLNSFFIVSTPNAGTFQKSASYDGMTWSALQVTSAESSPDNIVAVLSDHGELMVFGNRTTEIWAGTDDVIFPFQRVGSAIEYGVIALQSIQKFNSSIAWLARNTMGEVQIILLDGYTPTKISTHDLDNIINKISDTELAAATALSYMHDGHPFYQINFASSSWLYDASTQLWSEVVGFGVTRHRARSHIVFKNTVLIDDFETGTIYTPDGETYDDNGQPLVSKLVSKHIFSNGERFSIGKLWIDAAMGVGTSIGQGENPQILITVYKDHGHTPSASRMVSLGKIGEYSARAVLSRFGSARDWVFELTVSDPVKFCLTGAYVE